MNNVYSLFYSFQVILQLRNKNVFRYIYVYSATHRHSDIVRIDRYSDFYTLSCIQLPHVLFLALQWRPVPFPDQTTLDISEKDTEEEELVCILYICCILGPIHNVRTNVRPY